MNNILKTNHWALPRDPEDIEPAPWLAADAVEYFESLLTPEMTVCEFGGGGSTLWLVQRVKHVITYEPNLAWYNTLDMKRDEFTVFALRQSDEPMGMEKDIDLLFIDGEPVEKRAVWLKRAHEIVKKGGIVVLDNANRPEYANERAAFLKHADLIFGSKVQGKYLYTEFYRVK